MNKKLFTLIFTSIFTASLLFCQTTETVADSTETDVVTTETIAEDEYVTETSDESDEYESNEIENNYSKKERKPLISFGNVDKFILTEEFSLFSPNTLYKFKQKGATITIDPKAKQLGFGSQYLLAYYIVLFDVEGMDKFQKALNTYLSDFENKKLDRKSHKTVRKYGYIKGKMWWGTIKTSTPNHNKPRIYFGYEFYDNKPYFTISVPPEINDFFLETNPKAEKESLNLKYYFTKAQAKELAKYMTPDYLFKYVTDYNLKLTGGELQEGDDY